MPEYPPMPPPAAKPVEPNVLAGKLTDRAGTNITTGSPCHATNITHVGSRRVVTRTNGEIIINVANLSAGVVGDNIWMQCFDNRGNGKIWHETVSRGRTDISEVIPPIDAVIGGRIDTMLPRGIFR